MPNSNPMPEEPAERDHRHSVGQRILCFVIEAPKRYRIPIRPAMQTKAMKVMVRYDDFLVSGDGVRDEVQEFERRDQVDFGAKKTYGLDR
jgi:hypothetical protein